MAVLAAASLPAVLLLLLTTTTTTMAATPAPTPAPLNGACTDPPGCSDVNAECSSGTCRCRAGYFDSNGVCAAAASAVPGGLSITRGLTSLAVTWSAPTGVSGLSLQYQVSWGGAGSPQTTSSTSYTITGLTSNTPYTVRVKTLIRYAGRTEMSSDVSQSSRTLSREGENCAGDQDCGSPYVLCSQETPRKCRCPQDSYWSGSACVPSASAVPSIVSITRGLTSLAVTWSAPTGVSGLSPRYQVSWGGAGSAQTTSSTSYNITGLTSDTEYIVRVKTLISYAGRTEMSSDASQSSRTRVAYRGTCSSSSSECLDPNASCYAASGPRQCVCDEGFFWNSASCTAVSQLLPSAISVREVGTEWLTVSWTPSQYSSFVTSYVLTTSPASTSTVVQGGSSRSSNVTDLVPGGSYTITINARILADLRNQTTSPGRTSSTRTLKPETPGGLVRSESLLNETFVELVFHGVGRGYADSYVVTLGNQGPKIVRDSSNNPNNQAKLNVRFDSLDPGRTYPLTIVAQSRGVDGAAYTTDVRTASRGPSKVTALTVSDITGTSMRVSWSQPAIRNGDLFAYELLVLLESKCLQSVLFTCSVCIVDRQMVIPVCGETFNVSYEAVKETYHIVSREVTNLNPDVSYTLVVVGYTDGGRGEEDRVTDKTEIAPAEAPESLTGGALNSSSILLQWRPRLPRPGPTTYLISVLQRDSGPGDTYLPLKNFRVESFETNLTVVTGLRSFWEYQFVIQASTEKGASAKIMSGTVTTSMSAPGHVSLFSVTEKDFTSVTVSVRCPELENRNGRITKYMIKYSAQRWYDGLQTAGEKTDDIPAGNQCSSTERGDVQVQTKDIEVTPEYIYTLTVYPVNVMDMEGARNSTTYAAKPGRPFQLDVVIVSVLCAILGVVLLVMTILYLRLRRRGERARDPTYAQTAAVPAAEEAHPYTELGSFSHQAASRRAAK